MNTTKAAARDRFGTNTNYMDLRSRHFSKIHSMAGGQLSRCRECGSDYMRGSIDGCCQRCLQQIEYASRECPDVLVI